MNIFLKKGSVPGMAAAVWLLLSAGLEMVLRLAIPQYNFAECRYVPVLFLVFLLVFTGLSLRWEKKWQAGSITPAHIGNYFLIWKMSKLVVALLLFFLCYLWLDSMAFRAFLITFLLFYVVFMGLEIFVMRGMERRGKHSGTEKK
ncbi:MAG: hypothetical protein LBI89_02045 [Prevotellaceae bacterium]|jgi:uncharacterized membrane protein|nr:hypothetical protein [Prevotellaceae bacterium]